jgi:hypothetical protein
MRKFFVNLLMKIMFKTLPLIKYYPFKWFAPAINKSKAQPATQTPPPADQPKS